MFIKPHAMPQQTPDSKYDVISVSLSVFTLRLNTAQLLLLPNAVTTEKRGTSDCTDWEEKMRERLKLLNPIYYIGVTFEI